MGKTLCFTMLSNSIQFLSENYSSEFLPKHGQTAPTTDQHEPHKTSARNQQETTKHPLDHERSSSQRLGKSYGKRLQTFDVSVPRLDGPTVKTEDVEAAGGDAVEEDPAALGMVALMAALSPQHRLELDLSVVVPPPLM